jgi:hypothetical protein
MSKMGLVGLKSRYLELWVSSGDTRGDLFLCLFLFLEASHTAWLMVPFHILPWHHSDTDSSSFYPYLRDPCNYIGPSG